MESNKGQKGLTDFLNVNGTFEKTDLFQRVQKKLEIAWNKGIYSRDFMINTLGYTPKEVDSVEAYDHEADFKRMQDVASLMHQVVGS